MNRRIQRPLPWLLWLLWLFGCGVGCGQDSQVVPTYTGTVEVTEIDVAGTIPGRLAEVAVREGDRVPAGALLFRVETEATQMELEAREAAVEQARAAMATARSQREAVLAQVRLLERELERMRSLEKAGAGTAQQISQLQGQLQVARAQARAYADGIDQARAARTQARTAVRLVEKKLSEASTYAPTAGTVLSRNREPGEVVGAGMSVITLGDLEHPRLRVYVPLTTVERISLGTPVEVRLDVGEDATHQGEVSWISSEAEFTPRDILTPEERVKQVFAVEVSLPSSPSLHPGVPAEAVFAEE